MGGCMRTLMVIGDGEGCLHSDGSVVAAAVAGAI